MKLLGEPIFANDAQGQLLSRIGTIFFKTPGLVTRRGVHAMQRVMWLDEVNAQRAAAGKPPMTEAEEDEELSQSVDLIFTDHHVLIRPDPDHMDLAFRADEELQKLVSKRYVRFLNTHWAKVRNALRARGENWRMAREPISQEDMTKLILDSHVAIGCQPIYYYNRATGTRYITAGGYQAVRDLPIDQYRAQLKETVGLLARRNRMGHQEIELFPPSTPIEVRNALKAIDVDAMGDAELKAAMAKIDLDWRMSLPAELREESVENFEWRNAMCRAITVGTNETNAEESELIQGISPEFYRQIEWLPGARIDRGEVIFDPLWEEYNRTRDPELGEICDPRVRNIIFNLTRLFADIEYVNIGRIARSLARQPIEGARRGSVYIIQCRESGAQDARVFMIRFQKWCVAEHLDEGKDLLRSILESNEYADYIMDRRLMCQQLGMSLPNRIRFGQFSEPYNGENHQYRGTTVRAYYYVRAYVPGIASDKIPPSRFRNPAFAREFARLMGEAAATDLIVGRRSSETKENLFDKNYETVQMGPDGLPARVVVTDHAGSFVNYLHKFEETVAPYANVVRRRLKFVTDPAGFSAVYIESFHRRLVETQAKYRSRRRAFDELFVHRPFDVAGSGAYRWAKTLERLDKCDPDMVAAALKEAIEVK
ncbi:MAG: hypothetical protein IJI73_01615 [Kiritimatiellae bacterium]|nr:hypothetical protein [Kiritimatiellia bacterium]